MGAMEVMVLDQKDYPTMTAIVYLAVVVVMAMTVHPFYYRHYHQHPLMVGVVIWL